ncbi:hypothetical protein BDZ89DRAFT_831425 [Hymenopellis radicata]|nr:hypothetical protein BDZ89DRAFT_831425 [Hymenopellis radicata]
MASSTAGRGPIRSFEGKVGKRYEDLKLFITSPNMDFIAPPPFGTRTIHMYSNFTFGLDDPLNTAQIFHHAVGHLALIASSESMQFDSNSGRWLFSAMPSDQEFEVLDHHNPSNTLGLVKKEWRQILEGEIKELGRKVSTLRSEEFAKDVQNGVRDDKVIATQLGRLKYYTGRLENPMTRDETFMLWRLTQRTCLELEASIAWVSEAREQFMSPTAKHSPLRGVVGAYVNNSTMLRIWLGLGYLAGLFVP